MCIVCGCDPCDCSWGTLELSVSFIFVEFKSRV